MPAYSAVLQDDDIDALEQRVQREARRGSGVRIKKPGRRSRRTLDHGGQASWISSVINLVNTSMSAFIYYTNTRRGGAGCEANVFCAQLWERACWLCPAR